MARNRMIRPEFWSDEKIGELTFLERLLFIGLWNFADDEGLIKAHPMYIKSQIFPYDDIGKKDIEKAIEKLKQKELIYGYSNNNQQYAWIIKFRIYQRIDKPQSPVHPSPSTQNKEYRKAISKRDDNICHLCGRICDEHNINDKLNSHNSTVASIDHIIPTSNGGNNYPTNLKIACISCNKSRGAKEVTEYLKEMGIPGTFQEHSKNDIEPFKAEEKRSKEKEKEKVISDFYTTKKRKKISGFQLQAFNQFWEAFDDKNGKAEAGDSWIDLKVTEDLLPLIIAGAERYKIKRAEIVRKNGTPKMAQGWLSAKRWEDGGEVPKPRVVKDPIVCPKCQRECDELVEVRPGVELCPSCFRKAEPEVPGKLKEMIGNIAKTI